MKKRFTKIGALILSAVMLGGTILGGCGASDKKESGSETVSKETQTAAAEADSNFNAEGLPIVNEPETFVIAVPERSSIKSAAEKNCVIETEKATNIHIEWMEIPASGWDEKINIMFSTDSLPDAVLGDVDIARNYEQLAPLDEYLENYAPAVTAFFDSRDDYPASLIAPDGKIHCLPIGDESTQNIIDSQFWINTDWLEKVGKEMPQTPEEFKDVLIAFRDEDPNGNGVKDEIPFTFAKAWSWGTAMENLFGPFGVVENEYHVFTKDGKVTFSAGEQGYYDALAWMHDLYKEGLIDKDVFTMSDEQYSARGASGDIIGVMAGYSGDECSVDNGAPGEGRYKAVPVLKGKDGTQMVGINNVTKTGGFAISRNCKNPEALVRWYDYINSSLEMALTWGRGAEGVWWEILDENGKEVPEFLTMTAEVLEANGGYKSIPEYRNAESFAGTTPSLWRNEYDQALQYDDKWPHDWKLQAVKDQIPFGVIGLPAGTASLENAERRAILIADIDTYLQKFIADSVINGIDDEKWEAHLKNLENLKAEEYTALCQEYVDSYSGK